MPDSQTLKSWGVSGFPAVLVADLEHSPAALWIEMLSANRAPGMSSSGRRDWLECCTGGQKVFCGQSPFSKLAGLSAGTQAVCLSKDVENIHIQGIQYFLNSLIHVEFNMDIPHLAVQVNLAGRG